MRGLVAKFKYWRNKFSGWVDWILYRYYKFIKSDFNYNVAKKVIDNLDSLRILDNREYIKTRQKIYSSQSSVFSIIISALVAFFYVYLPNHKVTNENLIFSGIYAVFLLSLFLILMFWTIIWFISELPVNWSKKISLLLPLTLWSLFFSDFIKRVFGNYNLENNLILTMFIVSIVSMIVILLLFFIIKSQSIFQIEASSSSPAIILSILAILTLIFEVDLSKHQMWALIVLLLTISSTILDLLINNKCLDGHEIAQEIFQEQLLLEKPRYKELKKCYYHGGEKYKEKLLSTEKFLRLIKKREKYLIRRDKNSRYSYKSGFNPQNNISPTRNCLS
ncbi:hypothetical protein [Streptococcus sanguinis]|uniref:hypothetical protein n=1 Tax=Streptococcus sanguinis TaxID=1305 RepID=UPI00066DB9B4|nr:hypothetical protein [Streptococcus sanguinis]MBZ2039754.1 hypothetical protein [Streptococcus sanguinis]